MKTIQITIDEPLLEAVDRLTAEMRTNRSAFFRDAAQRALKRHHIAAMEEQHRRGYVERPQTREEVEEWLPEHPTSVGLVEKAAHAGRGHESPFGLASASLSGYHAHLARLKVVKVACVHETVGQIGPRRHSRVH